MAVVTIKLRRGYLADWENINPVLAAGEPGWAIDEYVLKVGDGVKKWTELPAINVPDIKPEEVEAAVFKYLEANPVYVTTDTTLSVSGQPADAAAVREQCLFNTDQLIFYAGDADDNSF